MSLHLIDTLNLVVYKNFLIPILSTVGCLANIGFCQKPLHSNLRLQLKQNSP